MTGLYILGGFIAYLLIGAIIAKIALLTKFGRNLSPKDKSEMVAYLVCFYPICLMFGAIALIGNGIVWIIGKFIGVDLIKG